MNQELKPIVKKILQFIYSLVVINTLITLGYTLTNLIYNHLAFDLIIALLSAGNAFMWLLFIWLNKKFNLKL